MSPALSDLPVRKVVRTLESIGFEYVRTKGSHAVYRHSDGRVVVIPQHGTIKRGTLSSILRQAGLTSAEFLDLLK
ncbi:type II toxin-antitoxin system HicA family toxin [Amycolatopsis sp. cmx-11-32]|uniref:type II toxin-antitoxin system HicA family toxin n=1 Tax=Amycolatopsis sp. cmx-11-32 TaxID=2785796 RepID=UPI0039E60B3B